MSGVVRIEALPISGYRKRLPPWTAVLRISRPEYRQNDIASFAFGSNFHSPHQLALEEIENLALQESRTEQTPVFEMVSAA